MEKIMKRIIKKGGTLTKAAIKTFPFPYKLWILVHISELDFISWNFDGTGILLHLSKIEQYLNGKLSILRMKAVSGFLKALENFQFERVQIAPLPGDPRYLLQYKNVYFQRCRLYLVAYIRRRDTTTFDFGRKARIDANQWRPRNWRCNLRINEVDTVSVVRKQRVNLRVLLKLNAEKRRNAKRLAKIAALEQNAPGGRTTKRRRMRAAQTIATQEDLKAYTNKTRLSSVLIQPCKTCLYAGFYGEYSCAKIKNFFGNLLPIYEHGKIKDAVRKTKFRFVEPQPKPKATTNRKQPQKAKANLPKKKTKKELAKEAMQQAIRKNQKKPTSTITKPVKVEPPSQWASKLHPKTKLQPQLKMVGGNCSATAMFKNNTFTCDGKKAKSKPIKKPKLTEVDIESTLNLNEEGHYFSEFHYYFSSSMYLLNEDH